MTIDAKTPEEYISKVPEDRKEVISKLRETVKTNLPEGFEECITYGMIGYVVPHSLYPNGYHCDPKQPLPFACIASQKNFVALYHSGIYADKELHDWFVSEYPNYVATKLDMGKSCIRFKKLDHLELDLVGEAIGAVPVDDYVARAKEIRGSK